MGIIFIVARKLSCPCLFTVDKQVVLLLHNYCSCCVFQVFDGLQVIMLSTLRGMSDVKIPMIFAFVAYLFIGIPTSYILAFLLNWDRREYGMDFLSDLGSAGILFYFRFKYNLRKKSIKKRVTNGGDNPIVHSLV